MTDQIKIAKGKFTADCPKGHTMKRHKRRDNRFQFYCSECDTYYTENFKIRRIERYEHYYDKFITRYAKEKSKGLKPSVTKLCEELKISKASIYRHLLSHENKSKFYLLIELMLWAERTLNGLYNRTIYRERLSLTHRSRNKDLVLFMKPSINAEQLSIKCTSNLKLTPYWEKSKFCSLSKDEFSFKIDLPNQVPLSQILISVNLVLRNYNQF